MNWIEKMTYILQPTKLRETKEALNFIHKEVFIQCSTDIDGSQLYNPDDYLNNSWIEFSIFKGFYIKTTDENLFNTHSEKEKPKTYATHTQYEHKKKRNFSIGKMPNFGLPDGYYDAQMLNAKNTDEFYDALQHKVINDFFIKK